MERQTIDIKLLKAIEVIKENDILFDSFKEYCDESSPKIDFEEALRYPNTFGDDLYAFLDEKHYKWRRGLAEWILHEGNHKMCLFCINYKTEQIKPLPKIKTRKGDNNV